MRKRAAGVFALIAFALLAALLLKDSSKEAAPSRSVVIAVAQQPLSSTLYIAQEKGFFEKERLNVALKQYSASADALKAVEEGRADFCTVADTPFMFAGLEGRDVLVVATVGDSKDYVKIVARRDRGIRKPEDLKGKTVGVRAGTSSEYFLSAYLTFNSLEHSAVRVVDMRFEDMAEAVAQGRIDAASAWDPFQTSISRKLGDNAVVLSNKFIYTLNWNIASRRDFIQRNPGDVVKLIRALVKATDYLKNHQEESDRIAAGYMGRGTVKLDEGEFDIKLEQSLIYILESQARWAVREGLTDKREVPDYSRMMYTDAMEQVRPEAMTVIQR